MTTVKETKGKMAQAIEHLKDDLKNIRTGRANPGMVEGLQLEVYGTMMRLQDLANITVPEARQLLITPYDASNTAAIGKGIEIANIGVRPIVDGNAVRISIPEMDESIRLDMVKLCHKKREEAKVSIRNARREGNDSIRKQKAEGDIPEDQMKRLEKEIQDLTDKFCKEADTLSTEKEKEVTTV